MGTGSPAIRKEQLARGAVLVVLYAATGLICLRTANASDPDLWWHLRSGEWILEHRAFPHTDPFSRFGSGTAWAAYSWLFELLILKMYLRWDLVGVVAYSTALVAAITVAAQHMIARLQPDFTKAVLLTAAMMTCLHRLFTPRPWLVTILLFAVEMDILLQARKTGKTRELQWLPVLFIVWANVHVQFINGLIVLGVAALEPLLERWWPYRDTRLTSLQTWPVFGACVLGAMVNPYGWRIYQVAFDLASQRGVLTYVTELHAIQFRGLADYLVLFLVLAAVASLAWSRYPTLFETILLAIGAFLSFRSQRDVWFIAIISTAVLASHLPRGAEEHRDLPVKVQPLLLAATGIVLILAGVAMHVTNSRLRARLAEDLPVSAVEFVKSKGFDGPLYNDYGWGGFLIWSLRMPVSLDGRAALHGGKRIERSISTWKAEPDWASDPELSTSGLIIAPVKQPLTQVLRTDPRFTLAFEDKVAAVFVSRNQQASPAASAVLPEAGRHEATRAAAK